MKRIFLALTSLTTLLATVISQAAPPVVSNVRAAQRAGTHYVDIYYNVSDPNGGPVTVYVHISPNGGQTWNVPVFTMSGAVGPGVTLGNDRLIVWNAGVDWTGQFNSSCKVRIVADDGTAPPAANMAYIPGGAFNMGDTWADAGTVSAERPVHSVFISSFFMDRYEVTGQLWTDVKNWASVNGKGYTFANAGTYKGLTHPIQTINWFDAVKWCNARSEYDGLTPCYYTDAGLTTIYKTGTTTPPYVNWSASGYRLPTEAEWEKAARGGLSNKRFPWGDTISQSLANYYGNTASYTYDLGPNGFNSIGSIGGTSPATSPAGSFAPNGYGLCDMAGNVWEWSWDWYDANWYLNGLSGTDNTRGPAGPLTDRVLRGGSWVGYAGYSRCGSRFNFAPSNFSVDFGFRCVRGL